MEQLLLSEVYGLSAYQYVAPGYICCWGEPASFVVFPVVGQVCLGDKADELAFLNHGGAVEQASMVRNGCPDNGDDVHAAGEVHQLHQCNLGLVEQNLLLEEVCAGVAGKAELGGYEYLGLLVLCLQYEVFYLTDVPVGVCNPYLWYSCRYAY